MITLHPVLVSGTDVAVGVSGFGSRPDSWRWSGLGLLGGRTTYELGYDSGGEIVRSLTVTDLLFSTSEVVRIWERARRGATEASASLRGSVSTWLSEGKSVHLAGFSLGARVVWDAICGLSAEERRHIEVTLLLGALPESLVDGRIASGLASFVNAYSREDLVLRWLFPRAEGGDTPVGLVPVAGNSGHHDVDLTDLVGRDHLWASENVDRLVRVCLGLRHSVSIPTPAPALAPAPGLSEEQIARLSSWVYASNSAWVCLGEALAGERSSIAHAGELDSWASASPKRLSSLRQAASARAALSGSGLASSERSSAEIDGLVSLWLARSGL